MIDDCSLSLSLFLSTLETLSTWTFLSFVTLSFSFLGMLFFYSIASALSLPEPNPILPSLGTIYQSPSHSTLVPLSRSLRPVVVLD
jgi:hypothetical protein